MGGVGRHDNKKKNTQKRRHHGRRERRRGERKRVEKERYERCTIPWHDLPSNVRGCPRCEEPRTFWPILRRKARTLVWP